MSNQEYRKPWTTQWTGNYHKTWKCSICGREYPDSPITRICYCNVPGMGYTVPYQSSFKPNIQSITTNNIPYKQN